MTQKIIPNLWCEQNAREVADFYTEVFPNSKITGGIKYPNSPEEGLADFQLDFAGKDLIINLNIYGYQFTLINAGNEFKPTPSISFTVNFDESDESSRKELDKLWEKLTADGKILMPLEEYFFSERYGWVEDKFGFNWQLILNEPSNYKKATIIPCLSFSGKLANQAENAMNYYIKTFDNSKIDRVMKYEKDEYPVKSGGIMYADFTLENQWFSVMDTPGDNNFNFNEAISLSINCKNQSEIDHFWEALSDSPENEQCGWCKDKFGVSWQVVYDKLEDLMQKPDAYKTMMGQKKIVIDEY